MTLCIVCSIMKINAIKFNEISNVRPFHLTRIVMKFNTTSFMVCSHPTKYLVKFNTT